MVADHIGGGAAHVEERVDTKDQQHSFLRQAEMASVAAITTSDARGTPATPLQVSIRAAAWRSAAEGHLDIVGLGDEQVAKVQYIIVPSRLNE